MKYLIVILIFIQTVILFVFVVKSARQRKKCNRKIFPCNVKNKESVDVIIAAREDIVMIKKCISSVLKSGFKNVVLCVDGGDSVVADEIAACFNNVKIIFNEQSIGKIRSQRRCLTMSTKDVVLIIDADISLIEEEVDGFVSSYFGQNVDFLCPYSVGESLEKHSLLFSIAESDRYMRQRIVRAGRDAYGVSNLSGYCILANRKKYLDIIDSNAIQDDVIATLNLLKKHYSVKTYHHAVCSEVERNKFIPYLLQKTRWTAGNIMLIKSYPALFKSTSFSKSFAFTSSFLLWYWSWWVDFVSVFMAIHTPVVSVALITEAIIKVSGLIISSKPDRRLMSSALYVLIWPLFSTICLLLSPPFLLGLISERKTRRL